MLQLTFIGVQSLYNVVFLWHSKMNQPHVRVHPLLFGLPFHAGHQSALRRISHVVQYYCRCGLDSQESACNAGDQGLIPGAGRSPGEGNGSPLQYSCLENSMDRGAWQTTAHRVTKSWTRLSITLFTLYNIISLVICFIYSIDSIYVFLSYF